MGDKPGRPLIVLTPGRFHPALAAMIETLAPGALYAFAADAETLETAIERHRDRRPGPRLIAFATDVIVSGRHLARLKHEAYNIHPGPPERPGWAPAVHAVLEGDAAFGVTLHRMVERVDAGPIVAVARFAIKPDMHRGHVDALAQKSAFKLFMRALPYLTARERPPEIAEPWRGRASTKRDLDALLNGAPVADEARRALGLYGLDDV